MSNTWVELSSDPLPVGEVHDWLVTPDCGGQVVFTGTVRDHAEGRDDVVGLEYEAYEEVAAERMHAVAAEARVRWPACGRIALLHRVGRLDLGDVAVVVGVAAGHRDEAFLAARFCIDTLKSSVPIWKKELWAGGERSDWGTNAVPIES